MQPLIFATNNKNKISEVRSILHGLFEVKSLEEADILIDIPEPHDTLEKNAQEKSTCIYAIAHQNCFSEDTGLEVTALKGDPGVRSARYAGEQGDSEKNIAKLLQNMQHVDNREAQFRTVISLILEGKEYQFEGICKGRIAHQHKGMDGFGYDPVFIPDGSAASFAEMSLSEKNKYSHRKKAMEKLIDFLKAHHGQN